MIYVREYNCKRWDFITMEEYNRREELAGPVSAFAIISCANPKPESVPTEHIEVTDGTPMPDSIVISCKGVTRTVSYMFYRNIDLKGPDSEKPCSVLTLILNDERKEKVKRKN